MDAARALGEIGTAAVAAIPSLLALVDDQKFLAKVEAQWEARTARGPDLPGSTGVYPTTAGYLRAEAALALWHIAEHERAVPILVEGLSDLNRGGRRAAARALQKIGPPASRTAAVLAEAARSDPDSVTREYALSALYAFGPEVLPVMETVIDALDDEDESVRSSAIHLLRHFGPAARAAVDRLWQIAGDAENGSNICAASALWQIDHDLATIDVFISGLAIDCEECRETCAQWLGIIGPPAERALPALQARLSDDDERVAEAAASAIQRITGRSPWN
jgi:HEAT repeat protein